MIARGRARLAWREAGAAAPEGLAEKALDHGEQALQIAKQCGYVWAERDAFDLIAEAARSLGDRERARSMTREADALRARLVIPEGYVFPKAKCWADLPDG